MKTYNHTISAKYEGKTTNIGERQGDSPSMSLSQKDNPVGENNNNGENEMSHFEVFAMQKLVFLPLLLLFSYDMPSIIP